MRMFPLFLTAFLSACGSAPPRRSILDDPTGAKPEIERTVAWYNGQPLSWLEVAEKVMELNVRDAVEKYVYWRVIYDQKRSHGIRHTQEELLGRSRTAVEREKRRAGPERFAELLQSHGKTEGELVQAWAKDPHLADALYIDKLIAYEFLTKGALDLDMAFFEEEEDAKVFADYVGVERDFEAAYQKVSKSKLKGRLGRTRTGLFTRDLMAVRLDDYVLQQVFELKRGETSAVLPSFQTGQHLVMKIVEKIAPREGAYAQLAEEAARLVLADPPGESLRRAFLENLFRRSKIEYEDRRSKGD